MKSVSVAEMKNALSECLSRVAITGEETVVTKRGKPIAALISIDQLKRLKTAAEVEGLAAAAGQWKRFHEIQKDVEAAFSSRGSDAGRKISL